MSDTYTGPPPALSEYDRLMVDGGEGIDPRALAHELAENPTLYIEATENLDSLHHGLEADRAAGADSDPATISRVEVLRETIDPATPRLLDKPRDLNTPEAIREARRAEHALKDELVGLVDDFRDISGRRIESPDHQDRLDRIDDILREHPSLSARMDERIKLYSDSEGAHHDHDDDDGNFVEGHLPKAAKKQLAAEDNYIAMDAFDGDPGSVEAIEYYKQHHQAIAAQEKGRQFARTDKNVYFGVEDSITSLPHYNYDKGQGKPVAEAWSDEIEAEDALQERLHDEMVASLHEWRRSGYLEDEAKVFSAMTAMNEHLAELDGQIADTAERHSYYSTLRQQRTELARSIFQTRYMREQVRIDGATSFLPNDKIDFRGRYPSEYQTDKSIAHRGRILYPDGTFKIGAAGEHVDAEGTRVEGYAMHQMKDLPPVTEPRTPEPPIDPELKGRARKAEEAARAARTAEYARALGEGDIIEDSRTINELFDAFGRADENWFENQSDSHAIDNYRLVAHVTRQRLAERLAAIEAIDPITLSPANAIARERALAESQTALNVVTYRVKYLEAGHTSNRYRMSGDGTLATNATMNGHEGMWMIRRDGSARAITRSPRGGVVYGRWEHPAGAY